MAHPRATALTLAAIGAIGAAFVQWVRNSRRREADRTEALMRRDRILDAVGSGAEHLLRSTSPNRLNEFVALLGEAAAISRVYVFQNHLNARGEFVASQRLEWVAPGVPAQIDNPALQNASYDSFGMERWKTMLGQGRAILGRVDAFPEGERELLKAQNVQSLVVLPIFIGDEWWGFIGFDEVHCERWWSPAEVDALKTSAGLVAAAVERDRVDETTRQLERTRSERAAARNAEWRSRFLAEAGRVLSYSLESEAVFEELARLMVPELGEWCVLDVLEGDTVRRVAVTHAGPEQARFAALMRQWEHPAVGSNPILRAIATGKSRVIPRLTDARLREHLAITGREVRPRSALIVPLYARGRVIGAMTLLSTEPGRYRSGALALAEAVAGRASLGLDNARLYARARRATQTRDDMLAIVSHDLRNPLNAISLSVGLLREVTPPEAERARKQFDLIERSVGRADHLIRDLLDVARLEAGQMRFELRPASSAELAREAVELHREQASAAGRRLVGELPSDLPVVRADRERLLQVFGNLLGNAIKFTPEGGRIELGAEATADAVRFRVTDTGPGIPADQLPHLFDPFWQAARKGEGAGLGLAIARGIVEAHGGEIQAASQVGAGTTISFTIPIATDREEPQPAVPPRRTASD